MDADSEESSTETESDADSSDDDSSDGSSENSSGSSSGDESKASEPQQVEEPEAKERGGQTPKKSVSGSEAGQNEQVAPNPPEQSLALVATSAEVATVQKANSRSKQNLRKRPCHERVHV